MAHLKTRKIGSDKRYDVCWREHGKERSRTFTLRRDADRYLTEIERKTQLGTLYEAPPLTLGEAKQSWQERWEIGVSAATAERARFAWPHFKTLEPVPLAALTVALLDDTVAAAAKVAPRQAQLGLGMVKKVLRDAQTRGQRVDPALWGVKAPTYDVRDPVFLTYPELVVLCAPLPAGVLRRDMSLAEFRGWMPESLRRLPIFAGLSGLRLGELLGLLDTDVDLADGSVKVQRSFAGPTKSRKRRRVDLCPEAVLIVREQLLARVPSPRGLVFPGPAGQMWNPNNFRARVFRPAVDRLARETQGARADDVTRLVLHDLRHTFASLMIAAGANPFEVADALGHSDKGGRPDPTLVWKRYAHLYEGSGKRAALALHEHLLTAVAS